MGAPYTSVTISGYDSNPPPDDGSQTEANRVKYATTKEKLADPLRTLAETINTNVGTAFGKVVGGAGVNTQAAPYTIPSTNQGKIIRITSAGTVTAPDATDVDDPFVFAIRNSSTGTVVLDGNGSQTIDGSATIILAPNEGTLAFTDGSNWFTNGRSSVSVLSTGFTMLNGSLVASVAASALTIALKGADGNDPSAGNPVYIIIRNATAATGDFTLMAVTTATSLVISSGSTMGATSGVAFRLWILGFNDAGTFRLGAINCRSGQTVYPLNVHQITSSSAEGGAGGADTALVVYTGTAVTSKPYQVLGFMTWEGTGLATAGTWNVGPTRIQLFGEGVPLPGATVQRTVNFDGAVASGATVIPADDTIPQSGEGIQFMTQAIVPSSAANLLLIRHQGNYAPTTNPDNVTVALFQDATANALAAQLITTAASGYSVRASLEWSMVAATTSATTFKIRAGAAITSITFNGSAGARLMGGVMASFLRVEEIMA